MLDRLKTILLKAVDLSALTFLEPVVRLCWGEEPDVQLKKIGRNILVPLVAVGVFLIAWTLIADQIQTKSGKLPGPGETWAQARSIWTTHQREGEKEQAYDLTGDGRVDTLARVNAELARLDAADQAAKVAVVDAEAAARAELAEARAPLDVELAALKARIKAAKAEQKELLQEQATALNAGDRAAYDGYLEAVVDGNAAVDGLEARSDAIKADIKALEDAERPVLAAARVQATGVAEARQHLLAMRDLLSERNRGAKLSALEAKKADQLETFYAAEGAAAYNAARKVGMTERQIERTTASDYPPSYTLPWQVVRSILCVFVGFLIGTAIAVPIGVLCGLSPVVMAAMTPFIALFKPVSPIVWLPIMLIIVSGLVGDPATNPLIQFLWSLPLIGWMEINPAFLASATVVALCSLWATLANTALGVASIDQDHINVARVLKLGFWSRLFKIVLPSALPLMFAGMRISLGVGWMVLIAAELLASSEGIGKYVIDQFNNGSAASFASLFVVVFVVGAIGLFLDRIMIVFQRLVSFDGSVASV